MHSSKKLGVYPADKRASAAQAHQVLVSVDTRRVIFDIGEGLFHSCQHWRSFCFCFCCELVLALPEQEQRQMLDCVEHPAMRYAH